MTCVHVCISIDIPALCLSLSLLVARRAQPGFGAREVRALGALLLWIANVAGIAQTNVVAEFRRTALDAVRAHTTVLADGSPTALLALGAHTIVLAY